MTQKCHSAECRRPTSQWHGRRDVGAEGVILAKQQIDAGYESRHRRYAVKHEINYKFGRYLI